MSFVMLDIFKQQPFEVIFKQQPVIRLLDVIVCNSLRYRAPMETSLRAEWATLFK